MDKGYIVRNRNKTEPIVCPCGSSVRLITKKDTSLANLHVTHITDSRKHYHKKCTEIYYILEGEGKMELSEGDVVDLKPGVAVMIKPGIYHRGYGDFHALIIGIPALQEDDEYFE
jgi:mannose-6-phosphate isomerase-like protein (cupin superfamily)